MSKAKRRETILFLCAHNDDQVIGAGGSIARYAKEGKEIITIIFSYGELSHPHFQRKVIIETRVKEASEANAILGGGDIFYLGLNEGKFPEEIISKDIYDRIHKIVMSKKPAKIFTHSIDDPHPDHKNVYDFTMDFAARSGYSGSIYSFNIWNFFINVRKRDSPRLIVDISNTFRLKVDAFNCHRSQALAKLSLMWNVYFQALMNGLTYGMKYAEVFYKVK